MAARTKRTHEPHAGHVCETLIYAQTVSHFVILTSHSCVWEVLLYI